MDPIKRWHACVEANDFSDIVGFFAADAVFLSPAVPQARVGQVQVARALQAAMSILNNDAFRFIGEWRVSDSAVLEFEGEIDGTAFGGVDIINWNEAGLITQFAVMLRPIMALGPIMPRMAEAMRVLA